MIPSISVRGAPPLFHRLDVLGCGGRLFGRQLLRAHAKVLLQAVAQLASRCGFRPFTTGRQTPTLSSAE
jgi:hypothetical protein